MSLVERLVAGPSTHVGDLLRLAALAVESDNPGAVDDLVYPAQHALRFGELGLAEQLAQARWTGRADCPRGWHWATRWPGRAADGKPTGSAAGP